jgi:hypothetical protein
MGPPFYIILSVCFLDPILLLLSDPILVRPLFRASTVARSQQLNIRCNEAYRRAFARRCFPLVRCLARRWVWAIHCEVPGLTATIANGVLTRSSSFPPPISLGPLRPVLLAAVGLFLSEVTWLELRPFPPLELSAAAVAVIEPVVILLSLTLDRYRLHGLNRRCVPPGQQVVFAGRRGMRPCLAQCTALNAIHVRMTKL